VPDEGVIDVIVGEIYKSDVLVTVPVGVTTATVPVNAPDGMTTVMELLETTVKVGKRQIVCHLAFPWILMCIGILCHLSA
jgi:hypothetical protein